MHKSDYDALVSNPVWREMIDTLEIVKTTLLVDLQNLDPVTDAGTLARQQGRLKMIEFILVQPKAILEEIEETIKEERKEG